MKHEDPDTQLFTDDLPTPANELTRPGIAPGEIVIGVLEGLDEQGNVLVNFAESMSDTPCIAISTVAINQQQAGRQVALLFAEGNIEKPVIMGLIHNPLNQMIESFEMMPREMISREMTSREIAHGEETPEQNGLAENSEPEKTTEDVSVDGKRVVIEGKEEVVFKCGEASITLTKAGKILIRGKYLLNRSTGVNRIMGGSVQVN